MTTTTKQPLKTDKVLDEPVVENGRLSQASLVLGVLNTGVTIRTVIRETSAGDVHEVPIFTTLTIGLSLDPEDLLSALAELKAVGEVDVEMQVAKFNSSKYILRWLASDKSDLSPHLSHTSSEGMSTNS